MNNGNMKNIKTKLSQAPGLRTWVTLIRGILKAIGQRRSLAQLYSKMKIRWLRWERVKLRNQVNLTIKLM